MDQPDESIRPASGRVFKAKRLLLPDANAEPICGILATWEETSLMKFFPTPNQIAVAKV